MLGLDRLKRSSSAIMASAGFPIAIDFGTSSLKVLQIGPGEPPVLQAAAMLPTPENLLGDAVKRLAFQIDALPRLIKQGGFRGKRAVCSMPAGQTFCKHLQIAPVAGLSMNELVQGAVAQQLGCNADALVCRMLDVGAGAQGGTRSEVIGLAASRATVIRLMGAIRSCKLEPVGMHPECAAVVRCFDHITKRAGDEDLVSLYLDLGLGCTRVIIANGTRPVFAKTIPLGGRFFDQTIAKQAKVDLTEARRMRMGMLNLIAPPAGRARPNVVIADAPASSMSGNPVLDAAVAAQTGSDPALSPAIDRREGAPAASTAAPAEAAAQKAADAGLQLPANRRESRPATGYAAFDLSQYPPPPEGVDLREPLETLTDELGMCLRYHEALFPGRRVGRIIFVGGESRHVALCQHIARTLKAPAHVADPLARLSRSGSETLTGVSFEESQPGWAVPVGLCLLPTDL